MDFYEYNSGCGPYNGKTTLHPIARLLEQRDFGYSDIGLQLAPVLQPNAFKNQIKPDLVFIGGDCMMPDMHDGIGFTMSMETGFLEGINEFEHRYDRNCSDENEPLAKKRMYEALAGMLAGADYGPKVAGSQFNTADNRIYAAIDTAGTDGQFDNVYAYYNSSATREFNKPGQPNWTKVAMVSAGTYQGMPMYKTPSTVTWPTGHMMAYYVNVNTNMSTNGTNWVRRDSSPIQEEDGHAYLSCEAPYPEP